MYNGRLYENVLVNVDAEEQKLVVRQSMDSAPTNPDGRQVEWFTWGDAFFVNLQYLDIPRRRASTSFFLIARRYSSAGQLPGVNTSKSERSW